MEFQCQQVYKVYHSRHGHVAALQDVNFTVAKEEFVSIVGPSGCGKTTLLKLIADLLPPTSGHIRFETARTNGHPRNAMVFQEHGLLPWLTVLDNVAFGLEMQGIGRQERHGCAQAFIEQVGLREFMHCYPHQLSVGMRQRTAIARAFVADPHILLLDEPFSSLDAQATLILREELLRIWREHKKTVVYVTHDIEEAILLSDRVLVMTGRPGTIWEEIPIALPRPRHLVGQEYPDVKEITWHIWKMLEDEVRQSLKRSV